MRWLVLFLLFLFLVAAGLLVFFTARFDPNDYRPYLESRLSEKLGLHAKLGNLSFTWRGGLGVQVDGLKLEKTPLGPPLFNADRILLHVDSLNLLRLKFVLKSQIDAAHLHYREPSKRSPLDIDLGNVQIALAQSSPGNAVFETELLKYGAALKGNVFYSERPFRFQGEFRLKQLDLETLAGIWKWLGAGRGGLSGTAQGEFKFEGTGVDPAEIKKSLRGKGFAEIRDGAIRDFNLVDSLLSRITVIPGLQEALIGTMPMSFQQVLKGRDMTFESLHGEFTVEDNHVDVKTADLKARYYLVQMQGTAGFEGEVNLRGKLELLDKLTDFLVHRVNELSILNNARVHLEIPFLYRGTGSSARLLPDVGHLVHKVVVTEGAELLEKGLEALSKYMGEKK